MSTYQGSDLGEDLLSHKVVCQYWLYVPILSDCLFKKRFWKQSEIAQRAKEAENLALAFSIRKASLAQDSASNQKRN